MSNKIFWCLSLVVVVSLSIVLGGLPAQAGTIVAGNAVIDISGSNGTTTMFDQVLVPIQSDGTFGVSGAQSTTPLWDGNVSASGNIDPFANLAFGVTNVAAVPIEFTVSVTVPIAAILGGTLHGGSTGGSVTDANFNGLGGLSTIPSVPGTPFYAGTIDAVTVLPIYPDPTSFGFPFTFAGQTINIPFLNFGLPGPTLPSGPALATIGITHRFLLSAGDSMSATSFFVVEPVPEPSSIALAGLGIVGLLFCVRRRRRS